MTVHLLKWAVGIETLDQFAARQARFALPSGARRMRTRMRPRRAAEILDGGSLYWVIKRVISVRQSILDIEAVEGDDGRTMCQVVLAPEHIETEHWPQQPFQGWRYLPPEKAPPDRPDAGEIDPEMPEHMVRDLRELGLI